MLLPLYAILAVTVIPVTAGVDIFRNISGFDGEYYLYLQRARLLRVCQ